MPTRITTGSDSQAASQPNTCFPLDSETCCLPMSLPDTLTVNGPDGLTTVVFTEANVEQRLACYKLAGAFFRHPLTEEDYLEREHFLSQQPLTKGKGWRFWCLVSEGDPNVVLATCKTMHRDLLVVDENGSSSVSQGYCIASVRTHPSFEKLGLITFLLRKLCAWMDGPEGNGTASMLYSDIGKDFYGRRGWKPLSAYHLSLHGRIETYLQEPEVSIGLLRSADIEGLCNRDVDNLQVTLSTGTPRGPCVLVLPTYNLVSWLHARSDFIGEKVYGRVPEIRGATCVDGSVWMYWYHDFQQNYLAVQRIVTLDSSIPDEYYNAALKSLLRAAATEARAWDLSEVIVWTPSQQVQEAAQKLSSSSGLRVELTHRQHEHLPALRWRCGEDHNMTEFLCNEFYGWA